MGRLVFWCCIAAPEHQTARYWLCATGAWTSYCLCRGYLAGICVPAHSGGVCGYFGFAEITTYPTPKGNVREPGSLTHPQVNPVEGVAPQRGSPVPPTPLHRGERARSRVPGGSGGVSGMFGEAEHSRHPTPKGCEGSTPTYNIVCWRCGAALLHHTANTPEGTTLCSHDALFHVWM
jgi:hypothetical protein